MQHAQLLDTVRKQVRTIFAAQGVADLDDCCETILIREGFYCGRCFACDSHRAIWFVEEKIIKFYGADGEFVTSSSLEDSHDTAVA